MKAILICPRVAAMRDPYIHNIGISYIAGALLAAGHDVEVIDAYLNQYDDMELESVIRETVPRDGRLLVGIGGIITAYNFIDGLSRIIKSVNRDAFIVVGNSVGSSTFNFIFDDMPVDAVAMGEGESTVVELAAALENDGPLEEVRGICYRTPHGFRRTPPMPLIQDLDSIPFPALEKFDMERYMINSVRAIGKRFINISTSRGCPYNCTYCYHAFQGTKVRRHSVERIISEIKLYRQRYSIESFAFSDDLFMINRKLVEAFCDALVRESPGLEWIVAGRVNSCLDSELLKKMRGAGCVMIGLGVESADQRILDNINKRATVDMARRAINNCRAAGIEPSCSFMIGNEGENAETVASTVAFIDEMEIEPPVTFFFATPYPDTELFRRGVKSGKIRNARKLVREYGEQGANLLVNFSQLSNAELISLKNQAQMRIVLNYASKHKRWFAGYIFRRARFYAGVISRSAASEGLLSTAKRVAEKILVRLRVLIGARA